MIAVRVGNGPEVPVLLDTGSYGLHIYEPGVRLGSSSGVTVTPHPNVIRYFDGTVQTGVVAKAKLTIGGVRTRYAVPFGLVQSLSCAPGFERCPGMFGILTTVAHGDYGIMGIGLARDHSGLGNPLLGMPGGYARVWSIELMGSRGRLVLGARIPSHPIARFRLKPAGTDPSGAHAWNDQETRVCWAAVGLRGSGCEPTVFDSGSFSMLWYGGLLSRTTTDPYSILVSPGTYIAAWAPGGARPFWTFTSGTYISHNTVLAYRGGHALVIAAVQSFYAFKIIYDAAHGQIVLTRH